MTIDPVAPHFPINEAIVTIPVKQASHATFQYLHKCMPVQIGCNNTMKFNRRSNAINSFLKKSFVGDSCSYITYCRLDSKGHDKKNTN